MSEEHCVTFSFERSRELLEMLRSRLTMTDEDAEQSVFDLLEIAKLFDKIYGRLIPDILAEPSVDRQVLQRRVWTIRDHLMFVNDHIHNWWIPE